jgi:hypothetical protein
MSTRLPPDLPDAPPNTGLIRPRLPSLFEDEMDDLEVSDAETRVQKQVNLVTVAQRLALKQTLRDLARLADGMPRESPSVAPPALESGSADSRDSRVTVPPVVASVPPPPMPSAPRLAALAALPSFSEVSVDPTVQLAPISPAFASVAIDAAAVEGPIGRGTWALMIGTLVVALVGGLLLGQALTSPAPSANGSGAGNSAMTPDPRRPNSASVADRPASVASQPAPRASAVAPAGVESPATEADPGESTVPALTLRAPRPTHHGGGRSAAKAAAAASPASDPGTSAAKGSQGSRPVVPARDSVDDPVRRPVPVN